MIAARPPQKSSVSGEQGGAVGRGRRKQESAFLQHGLGICTLKNIGRKVGQTAEKRGRSNREK